MGQSYCVTYLNTFNNEQLSQSTVLFHKIIIIIITYIYIAPYAKASKRSNNIPHNAKIYKIDIIMI